MHLWTYLPSHLFLPLLSLLPFVPLPLSPFLSLSLSLYPSPSIPLPLSLSLYPSPSIPLSLPLPLPLSLSSPSFSLPLPLLLPSFLPSLPLPLSPFPLSPSLSLPLSFPLSLSQVTKLKEEIQKVRDVLANRDNESAESIGKATGEMQKASLKLFEMAYKKVSETFVWTLHLISECKIQNGACRLVLAPNLFILLHSSSLSQPLFFSFLSPPLHHPSFPLRWQKSGNQVANLLIVQLLKVKLVMLLRERLEMPVKTRNNRTFCYFDVIVLSSKPEPTSILMLSSFV